MYTHSRPNHVGMFEIYIPNNAYSHTLTETVFFHQMCNLSACIQISASMALDCECMDVIHSAVKQNNFPDSYAGCLCVSLNRDPSWSRTVAAS